MAYQRLKEAAEKAKIDLSGVMSASINLPFITSDQNGPKHLDMTLTRAKFDELTADLVDKTIEPMTKALKDAGLTADQYRQGHPRGRFHAHSRRAGCGEEDHQERAFQGHQP